ncbi:hypothetical protein RugamoR64_39710 [Duganella rhizosphaerae]|uniref:lysozyme inhibitor LprI family protein n=1 Tax=Duganella rhizosphaerae TaxID=2885763 RepID=UPI0030E86C6E
MSFDEFQSAINGLYQNDWFKFLALPTVAALYKCGHYLWQRKIEGKPVTERIAQLHQIADLKAKLDKDGTTIEELQSFGAKALGRSAEVAIVTAKRYAETAYTLVTNADRAEHDPEWGAAQTQLEMNELSARKAFQADDDLGELVSSYLPTLTQESQEQLDVAQSAWSVFRDVEVEREAKKWEGGSIQPLMRFIRYEAITRERIASLSSEIAEESNR